MSPPPPNSPRKSVRVVASIREGLKVRQKLIHHVGIAHDESEVEKLKLMGQEFIAQEKLRQEQESPQLSLPLQGDFPSIQVHQQQKLGRKPKVTLSQVLPTSQVTLDQIIEERRIVEGIHDVGGAVYDQLGYNSILSKKADQQLLKDLVLARVAQPASKHYTQKVLAQKFAKDHDLDRMYRLLDRLHDNIDQVKKQTFLKTKALMPDKADIVFFDVTTLYFESVNTDDLREFGYSKDHRFNTTQVVLALATNSDGLPIGYELFRGNTAEVKTLIAALDAWKESIAIGSVCFVGDRAMMSKENIKALEDKGYTYVIAAKLRALPQALQKEILEASHYQPMVLGQDFAWVGEFTYNQQRLVVSYKTARAHHDATQRDRVITKIKKRIGDQGDTKKLITNQGVHKYTTSQESQTAVNQDKIDRDTQWDGMHGVITNLKDVQATQVLQRYARLWVIEESFRINKHTLSMRPIYHFKPKRIEAHIALCYMAFALLRHLQYKVQLVHKITPNTLIDELMAVQSSIYVHKQTGHKYRVPSAFSRNAAKIYKAVNLTRNPHAQPYLT